MPTNWWRQAANPSRCSGMPCRPTAPKRSAGRPRPTWLASSATSRSEARRLSLVPVASAAYGSSLLRLTCLAYFGSAPPSRRYFLIVLHDRPVRRANSRMDNWSRNARRLMTLRVATSITPTAPCHLKQQARVLAWVSFGWKYLGLVGQFKVEINTAYPNPSVKGAGPRRPRLERWASHMNDRPGPRPRERPWPTTRNCWRGRKLWP